MRRYACPLLTLVLLPITAAAEPLTTGEWLLHLGRDYPLSQQASATNADARITLLLMQAASRVAPDLPEPWYWQADMLAALQRPAEARATLGEYVRRRPEDVVTFLHWIELSTDVLQTAEERAEFHRRLLREGGRLPHEVQSDLHRRLAGFHWNRGEQGQAREQAEAALAQYKMNFAARQLLDQIQGVPLTAARRLEWALAGMVLNPADAGLARSIGDLLTSWGMTTEAARWYQHADRLIELATGEKPAATRPGDRPEAGAQPAPPEAEAMLRDFPWAVLDYPFNPGKYLALSWAMPRPELPPGEPWKCTVRLTNKGPFPITFGPQHMITPDLLCSITTRGDRERTSGPTLQFSLYRRLRLAPGETIEDTWMLNLGAIRASMIGTPQVTHRVEVAGVLSPVRLELEDGREAWVPAIGGLTAPPLRFERVAFEATRERVRAVIQQSQSGNVQERIAAMELLAMLLAEHQHLAAGRLRYSAYPIDAAAVEAAILARAADPDWRVRARLAETMRWFGLTTPATQTATRLLTDSHWLVRGLAIRMLADQHREKARPVLERTAENDADEWVRSLAAALLQRMMPTTQPGEVESTR